MALSELWLLIMFQFVFCFRVGEVLMEGSCLLFFNSLFSFWVLFFYLFIILVGWCIMPVQSPFLMTICLFYIFFKWGSLKWGCFFFWGGGTIFQFFVSSVGGCLALDYFSQLLWGGGRLEGFLASDNYSIHFFFHMGRN